MSKLQVEKKDIENILNIKGKKYLIPDYQRPYAWDKEQCNTLWSDLCFFYETEGRDEEYYLGTIVVCKHGNDKIEVIDGQQRLTSFLLLLRAFYYKLENAADSQENQDIQGLMSTIAPCIWIVGELSRQPDDKANIRIESNVVNEHKMEIFCQVLKTGEISEGKSQYEKNYQFFLDECEEYIRSNLTWKEFFHFVLTRCILLPIECENFNTALTIFNTLNNRGLPLSDSDIFKSQIYKLMNDDTNRKEFVEQWKELEEITSEAGFGVDTIFRYYSHYLRGKEGNIQKEIGLRKFYAGSGERYDRLNEPAIMEDLLALSEFWKSILNNGDDYISDEGKKYLHCLLFYPNEYWRYIVSVFFLIERKRWCAEQEGDINRPDQHHLYDQYEQFDRFRENFTKLLKKLTAFFYAKFILRPNVNDIKMDTFYKCRDLCLEEGSAKEPHRLEVVCNINDFKERIIESSSRIEKGLLLIHAYLYDPKQPLIGNFELEHIFPRIWQKTSYQGWTEEKAEKYFPDMGNKIVIEKSLNIRVRNDSYGNKKSKYSISKIKELEALPKEYSDDHWLPENIQSRRGKIIDCLVKFFIQQEVIREKE